MPDHDLTVSSDVCAEALAKNPPLSVSERIGIELSEMAMLQFNYAGHGEIPIRDDSMMFMDQVLDQRNDKLWEGLVLEAVGLNPSGVPFWRLESPVTKRKVQFAIPCHGVVCWIQKLPDVIMPSTRSDEDAPTIVGFTRIVDDTPETEAACWAKVEMVTSWCRSSLIVPGR